MMNHSQHVLKQIQLSGCPDPICHVFLEVKWIS